MTVSKVPTKMSIAVGYAGNLTYPFPLTDEGVIAHGSRASRSPPIHSEDAIISIQTMDM